jgi:hypothetical protein
MKVLVNLDSVFNLRDVTKFKVNGFFENSKESKIRIFINGEPCKEYTTRGGFVYFDSDILLKTGLNTIQVTVKCGKAFFDKKYEIMNYRTIVYMLYNNELISNNKKICNIETYKYSFSENNKDIKEKIMVDSSICTFLNIESLYNNVDDGWLTLSKNDKVVSVSARKYVVNNMEKQNEGNNIEIKDDKIFFDINILKEFGVEVEANDLNIFLLLLEEK